MTTIIEIPVSKAIEALARDLEKLSPDDARAVIEEAREKAYARWVRQQIAEGDASGEDLDGPTVMAELLAEAEAEGARRSASNSSLDRS